jgi:phosphate transport system permease protein
MAIVNLAGVPSIVYGLFGLGIFVLTFNFGMSLLSASLTLACQALAMTITTSREAILAVPREYREGSLAIGATRWQMVRHIVLPQALPGIITGDILAMSRAAGETAPILVVGAPFSCPVCQHHLLTSSSHCPTTYTP